MESPSQVRFSCPPKIRKSSKVYKCDHPSLVLQRLNEQRGCNVFCDVVLVVEEEKIPAHRNVLAACSDYFHTMFTIGMQEAYQKEVELFGVTCLDFKAILDFLYGGNLSLNSRNVDTMLETAHLLQIWEVVDFCCEYLENEVDEENYLYLQELASIFNLKRLDSFIDAFIMKNFATFSFMSDFQQNITVEKLCHYLDSTGVQQKCENDLLIVALRWLLCHREQEKEAYRVLENIHFPLISNLHLVKLAIRWLLPREPRCEGLVDEAIHYCNQVAAQPVLQNKRTALRSREEKLLFVGGEMSEHGLELSKYTCFLDPKTGWITETLLPHTQSNHSVAVLGGFIFLAGGRYSCNNGEYAASSLLYRYDPRSRVWIKLASMGQQRTDFYLGAIRDMLVAVGGKNENGALSSVETYSPEKNTWSDVASLPRFMYGHAGAIHEELIYISGGHDYQTGLFLKNLLCYDYWTDTWEERRPMITARGFHSMSTLQNDIYAIGGSDSYLDMTRFDILEVESYSPKCNQWTRVVPLLQANSKSAVATWDGKIYILGGYSCKNTNSFSKAVQVYDKTSKQWQKGTDLPEAIAGVSACVCVLRPKPRYH